MDNVDLMPFILAQRVKDLKRIGFQVTLESGSDRLLTLHISKAKTDQKSRHYIFHF